MSWPHRYDDSDVVIGMLDMIGTTFSETYKIYLSINILLYT